MFFATLARSKEEGSMKIDIDSSAGTDYRWMCEGGCDYEVSVGGLRMC